MTTTVENLWRILRELAESQKETDRRFQETREQFKETYWKFLETDRHPKEVTANIGKLGNWLGDFIEEAVRPAAVCLFRLVRAY